MCSERVNDGLSAVMGQSNFAIRVQGLSKCYELYAAPKDRLKQFMWRGRHQFFREFWALRDVSFEILPGEVVGIIGRNGSGKSTLLQLICGTLTPTAGEVSVKGRVAALLELGAGFNPEFTGRENVLMSAAIMGLSQKEITDRYEGIIEFSGIGDFIDQPVKTYSSGMYVRLAFSVAISVDPDILVIDEALSVGDGVFARKSFDRIMALKEAGKTILFCSHSMYQIDALCQRALWLNKGRVRMFDVAGNVTSAYNTELLVESPPVVEAALDPSVAEEEQPTNAVIKGVSTASSTGRIVSVYGRCGDQYGTHLRAQSLESTVSVTVEFVMDPLLPRPTVALGIENAAGMGVSSVISSENDAAVVMDANGRGQATVVFPHLPLMKGEYRVAAFLACEKGLHVYDWAAQCLVLDVSQQGAAQGVVELPHEWRTNV